MLESGVSGDGDTWTACCDETCDDVDHELIGETVLDECASGGEYAGGLLRTGDGMCGPTDGESTRSEDEEEDNRRLLETADGARSANSDADKPLLMGCRRTEKSRRRRRGQAMLQQA